MKVYAFLESFWKILPFKIVNKFQSFVATLQQSLKDFKSQIVKYSILLH